MRIERRPLLKHNKMAGEEELGAEFLITLKRRGVMPEILDAASKCLAEMLEPMEEQSKFEPCYLLSPSTGTNPTEAIDRSDISPPKIDTVCMNKEPSFSMPLSLPFSHWELQSMVPPPLRVEIPERTRDH